MTGLDFAPFLRKGKAIFQGKSLAPRRESSEIYQDHRR